MAKHFEEHMLNKLYIYEVWWLTRSIITQSERLFEITPVPDEGYSLKPDYEAHSLINNILSESARVKKLITTPKNKTREETPKQFEIHKKRCEYLQDSLSGFSMSEMLSVKVRNSLEHFDEYLDEANILATEDKLRSYASVAYNMVFSHRQVFQPQPFPMRIYISSEKVFLNMKASVNMGKIYEEASAINSRVEFLMAESNGGQPAGEPGGLLIKLV